MTALVQVMMMLSAASLIVVLIIICAFAWCVLDGIDDDD